MIVCPLHWYTDATRMRSVEAEMRRRGAPILRGHFDHVSGSVFLCEGTHRIHAAATLGLTPRIVNVRWWRSARCIVRARYAAAWRGIEFASVEIVTRTLTGETG